MKRRLRFFLQALVTALLLLWVLSQVDVLALQNAIRQISVVWLAAIIVISFLVFAVAARRSQLLAGLPGGHRGLWLSYCFYLAGMFYNQFLPTSVGGDIARIYLIQKQQGKVYQAASSVLLERALGLVITLLIAIITGIYLYGPGGSRLAGNLLLLWLVVLIITLLLFHPRLSALVERLMSKTRMSRLLAVVHKFLLALQEFRKHPLPLLQAGFLSIIYQAGDILVIGMLGDLVGISVPLSYYFLFIPIVYVVSLLPISINGLGVRENSMVFLFSGVGGEPALVLLLSLLIYLDRLIKGLAGGIWLLSSGGWTHGNSLG